MRVRERDKELSLSLPTSNLLTPTIYSLSLSPTLSFSLSLLLYLNPGVHECCANHTSNKQSLNIQYLFSPPKHAHSALSHTPMLHLFAPARKVARGASGYLHFRAVRACALARVACVCILAQAISSRCNQQIEIKLQVSLM